LSNGERSDRSRRTPQPESIDLEKNYPQTPARGVVVAFGGVPVCFGRIILAFGGDRLQICSVRRPARSPWVRIDIVYP
ncbi:hypothetical protein KCU61_g190, partial [Aureobasidium melanogenum]